LFGKMKYELGDHSYVKCPELGLAVDIEFKTKGYFSGTYNAIGGFIKDTKTDKNLYELSGMWTGEMFIKDLAVSFTGRTSILLSFKIHYRLARKNSFLMLGKLSILHQQHVPSKSKRKTSLNVCGIM
jgi:hypothetical protein